MQTTIGNRCQITIAGLGHPILEDDTALDVERKLVMSKIGNGPKILNANALLQKDERSRPAKALSAIVRCRKGKGTASLSSG